VAHEHVAWIVGARLTIALYPSRILAMAYAAFARIIAVARTRAASKIARVILVGPVACVVIARVKVHRPFWPGADVGTAVESKRRRRTYARSPHV
jgi:hypothetical protein